MHAERRKQTCEALELIEEYLLIELLHAWRDKKITDFWTAVDQLIAFTSLKEKVCKD